MAVLTSQPSLDAAVAALKGQDRDTGLDPDGLQELSDYWADVRLRYACFETGLKPLHRHLPLRDARRPVHQPETPGGVAWVWAHRFEDVKEMYKTVNDMLGDP